MRIAITIAVVALAMGRARADEVDDLEARGEEFAKQREYSKSIEAFKAADLRKPRALHACMIGLAYMRRELWPQAELFLSACERRAVPGDQPPEWIDEAEHELAVKLSAARIAAVTIIVNPAAARASIRTSAFAADETFPAQTIHLPPGRHFLEISAPTYKPIRREIAVELGVAQTVTIELERDSSSIAVIAPPDPKFEHPDAPPAPPKIEHREPAPHTPPGPSFYVRHREHIPWLVVAVGGVLGGVAIGYDLGVAQPARNTLAHTTNALVYDAAVDDFTSARTTTYVLAGSAVLAIGVGVALHYTVFKREHVSVTAGVAPHGGAIAVEWPL